MQLVSFSYRRNPKGWPGATATVDVSDLPNPYRDLRLRELTGEHPDVQAFVSSSLAFKILSDELLDAVADGRLGDDDVIAVGCVGGKHRSVACVELMAKALDDMGIVVTKKHTALEGDKTLP
jgi:UPF0042 nucleotide-binding protein